MKKILFFFATLFFGYSSVFSQIQDSISINISRETKYWVKPIQNEITFFQLTPSNNSEIIKITHYDSVFTQISSFEKKIKKKYYFQNYWSSDSISYFLLSQRNYKKHLLLSYSLKKRAVQEFFFETFIKTPPEDLKVLGNYSYIASYLKKKPIILQVNLKSKKSKVLPYPIQGNAKIEMLKINQKLKMIDIIFSSIYRKETFIHLKTYDENGNSIQKNTFKDIVPRSFISTSISRINKQEFELVGTYSEDFKKVYGIYVITYKDNKESRQYTPMSSFRNYYSFLSDKEEQKTKALIVKRKEKGKSIYIDERLLIHDVIRSENGYNILAEAYFPTYRQESYVTYYFGRPIIQYRTVFDGWKKSHLINGYFSESGKLLNDSSVSISSPKSYSLYKDVFVLNKNSETRIIYNKNKSLHYSDLSLKEDTTISPIGLPDIGYYNITKWYDNNLIALFLKKRKPQFLSIIIHEKRTVVLSKLSIKPN